MGKAFAIITGASTGIGHQLAKIAAAKGYDLLLVADEPPSAAAADLHAPHVVVEYLEADLATTAGVNRLLEAAAGRQVDILCANAGRGLGGAFLDQEVDDWRRLIDTNVTGTLYLLHRILNQMVARNGGKVLITGSIAGFLPGSFAAVYNGTKAFIDNFADALRNEVQDAKRVTITTLMPGPVETEFFARAGMLDTAVGAATDKSDPADVARDGWDAMMAGHAHIVSGWKNKIQATLAHVTPASVLAEQHRKQAEPGSAEKAG